MLESMPLKSLTLMALRYLEEKKRLLPQIHTTCLIGVLLTLSKWAKGRLAILVNRFLLALLGAGKQNLSEFNPEVLVHECCEQEQMMTVLRSRPFTVQAAGQTCQTYLIYLFYLNLYRSGIKSRRRNIFNMQHSGCQNLLMMCILRF